jgi:hypothetical protein
VFGSIVKQFAKKEWVVNQGEMEFGVFENRGDRLGYKPPEPLLHVQSPISISLYLSLTWCEETRTIYILYVTYDLQPR